MFRLGALVLVVGQGCKEPAAPVATTTPALEIPPLVAGADAGPRTRDGIRFGHPVPSPGRAWRVAVLATSRSEDPAGDTQISTYESNLRVEVLAVDGPAPSRVRLHFLQNAESFQGIGKPTIVEHKDYVVDARAPHVRDTADHPAPAAEAQRVLDAFPDLGMRARVDQVLPTDAMQLGERRDELAAAVLRIVHPRAWTMHAGTATLVRADGEHAVFMLSLDASSESGLLMQLTGEAKISLADSEVADLSLDGRYETKKDAGPPEPPGTFRYHRQVTSDPSPRSDR